MNATQLISRLTQTVGEKYIITDPSKTEQYRQGYRFGEGKALAVVRPGTVLEMWQILQACVEAECYRDYAGRQYRFDWRLDS